MLFDPFLNVVYRTFSKVENRAGDGIGKKNGERKSKQCKRENKMTFVP